MLSPPAFFQLPMNTHPSSVAETKFFPSFIITTDMIAPPCFSPHVTNSSMWVNFFSASNLQKPLINQTICSWSIEFCLCWVQSNPRNCTWECNSAEVCSIQKTPQLACAICWAGNYGRVAWPLYNSRSWTIICVKAMKHEIANILIFCLPYDLKDWLHNHGTMITARN